jgi:hypothetical protein
MFETPWAQLEVHARLYPELVVVFVMDSCPHCPVMLNRIEKLLSKDKLLDVAVVRFDEDRHGVLHEAKVRAFPTLQKYVGGKLTQPNFRPQKNPEDADLRSFLTPKMSLPRRGVA